MQGRGTAMALLRVGWLMMQRVGYLTVLLLLLSSLVLVACESDPIAPAGDISGYASLRDERGERLADHSGMRVQLRGTNLSALTDTSGYFTISGVPAGIYDLDYSKPGFASNQFRAFQFVGGGTAYLSSVVELIRSRADTLLLDKPASASCWSTGRGACSWSVSGVRAARAASETPRFLPRRAPC